MKKQVLLLLLCASLGAAHTAQAQGALVNLIGAGIGLGTHLASAPKKQPAAAPAQRVASAAEVAATFQQLTLQRTAATQLPTRGAEAVAALEAQLERCHQAYLADSTGAVCPPAQRVALQQASVQVAQANPGWNTLPYQREAGFYLKEDTRRQLVASGVRVGAPVGASPAKPPLPTVASATQVAAKFRQLQVQRTAPDELPAQGAEPITALEAALARCQAALQADSMGVICSPAQRTALQQASVQVAQANPKWNLQPYQREASFYIDEDARRQLVRTGLAVPVANSTPRSPVAVVAAPAGPAWVEATFWQLRLQRTPSAQLPPRGAEQIAALETELERCHQALLAAPTGVVCSPAQRTALQQASVRVAQANSAWSMQAYQQEASFYLAEDARRQQATAPAR